MVDKKFWAGTFTLTGTIIGAGILGLPYVFYKSGFFIGLFWLIILGVIVIFTKLCLGEVILRTKTKHQLPGYAKKYLGIWGKRIMFFAMVFGIYSALLAYLIGEGQSFSKLFTGNLDYAIYFAIGFWLIMTLLLRKGLKELKKIEVWGVLGIIIIIIFIVVWFAPQIKLENLNYTDSTYFFLPFGVILFALLGFTSIPEVRMEMNKDERKLKKVIIYGSLIPIILYIIFTFVFIGALDGKIEQVATISSGKIMILLGIFTMLTSYFVLSFALKDMFKFDFGLSKNSSFILVSILPIVIYLLVTKFNLLNFITILGIGGVISGGTKGILILLMNKKAKKQGDRKPEYSIPINWIVIIIFSIIFIGGIITEILL